VLLGGRSVASAPISCRRQLAAVGRWPIADAAGPLSPVRPSQITLRFSLGRLWVDTFDV